MYLLCECDCLYVWYCVTKRVCDCVSVTVWVWLCMLCDYMCASVTLCDCDCMCMCYCMTVCCTLCVILRDCDCRCVLYCVTVCVVWLCKCKCDIVRLSVCMFLSEQLSMVKHSSETAGPSPLGWLSSLFSTVAIPHHGLVSAICFLPGQWQTISCYWKLECQIEIVAMILDKDEVAFTTPCLPRPYSESSKQWHYELTQSVLSVTLYKALSGRPVFAYNHILIMILTLGNPG